MKSACGKCSGSGVYIGYAGRRNAFLRNRDDSTAGATPIIPESCIEVQKCSACNGTGWIDDVKSPQCGEVEP
jgi:hypothetical protein